MGSWVIKGQLAVSSRPGYTPGEENLVPLDLVETWIADALKAGIRSIICLLGDDQLPLYSEALPEGLINRYRSEGFDVVHISVRDGLTQPFTEAQLAEAWASFQLLPKPVLVHCSAGHDRTGRIVRHIQMQLEDEE